MTRRGAVEVTLSAVAAVVIAIIVIAIVFYNVFPEIKMAVNSGKDIKGSQYFDIQQEIKLCQAWHQVDFMDTIKFGVDAGFANLKLNNPGFQNPICLNQALDYENCTKKCVSMTEIGDACAKHTDKCYQIDAAFDARCELEGCVALGGLMP